MDSGFIRKKIEPYFLERETPYAKRRAIKTGAVYKLVFGLSILFVSSVLFFGGRAERKEKDQAKLDYSAQSTAGTASVAATAGSLQASPSNPNDPYRNDYRGGYSRGGGGTTRTRTAAQIVRRGGSNGGDLGARLPMGYGIPVTLINSILSSDSTTPVIAEVAQDVFPPGENSNEISIPVGTHVIGSANYDSSSQRIQIHFNTLVYPEGDQHGFQGLGMMSDGSAGLVGDYHSGEVKRQIGSFIGNFASGMAQGMMDRQAGGLAGIPYETGSIKNGLLNGVSQSTSDATKQFSENLAQTKPTMTLQAGQSFVIFLEHEYTP